MILVGRQGKLHTFGNGVSVVKISSGVQGGQAVMGVVAKLCGDVRGLQV